MIIGIDETGNFDENSELRHLFIAAFIETENGKLDIKRKQFYEWEASIPDRYKTTKGEIKGNSLPIEHLQHFLKQVVFEMPLIRTSVVSIIPKKNIKALIEKHHVFEVRQAEYNHHVFSTRGSKKYNINFLDSYSKWLKKRSLRDYIKMHCLKHLLKDTFHNAVIHCILNERMEETLNFSYKIDRDFLTEENIYWEHYSKSSIENYTKSNPFVVLDTWDDDHPFIKKYMFNVNGRSLINIKTIYENLRFLDSKDNFEIRIADIIGIVYNRFFNRNEFVEEHHLLSLAGIINDAHIEIIFNDFDPDETFRRFTSETD